MRTYTAMVNWVDGRRHKQYTIRNIFAKSYSDARTIVENHQLLKNKVCPSISCLWLDWNA